MKLQKGLKERGFDIGKRLLVEVGHLILAVVMVALVYRKELIPVLRERLHLKG